MFTAVVLSFFLPTGWWARDPGAQARAGHGPAETPAVFAPGRISTDAEEYRITFTPDGRTAYFARGEKFFPASRRATIMVSHLRAGRWSAPQVAPFSGTYSDIDPFISPDGSKLYFSSIRPVGGAPRKDLDLWVVERTKGGWGEPRHLGGAVNSEADELYPSVAADGTLYFGSERKGGAGGWDIYRSKPTRGGAYTQVENLGDGVNTQGWEFNPTVSRDGKLLVFTSLNRAGGEGLGDLYLSRSGPGGWSPARSLGAVVNTKADEYHPSFSPDGRHLFFVRRPAGERTPTGDIYRVGWAALLNRP